MRVILVFFDTMRHDHASCYGYAKQTTPTVDRLAAEGALFRNAYPTDVPTQPCYTSALTGKRGITTGIVTHGQPEATMASRTFPEALAENGVLTAGISTLYRFRRWFAQGFMHYLQPDIKTWLQHVRAYQVNELAIPWLKAYGQQDFFLFLHYWDPHTPYQEESAKYIERFYQGDDPYDPGNHSLDHVRAAKLIHFFLSGGAVPELRDGLTDIRYPIAQYDAEILYADEHFAEVLETLESLKIMDDTMIVFTSDHGEAFGEHQVLADHMDGYEQVSHVPLIIRHPARIKPQQIDALVQHIDLAPTILEAFGVPVAEELEGRSLWPLLEGKEQEHYDAVFTNQGLWSAQRAMRTKEWTLMKTIAEGILEPRPPTELFDRTADPAEADNVADDHPEVLADLEATYHAWLEDRLGPRPDPLRIAGAESAAANNVKARYRRHLEELAAKEITPADRAAIDDRPSADDE